MPYAVSHHPDVTARKLASGIPMLNDFRAADWRKKITDLGGAAPRSATKVELYKIWRNLTGTGR